MRLKKKGERRKAGERGGNRRLKFFVPMENREYFT